MVVLHVCAAAPEPWVLEAIRRERVSPLRIQTISRPELAGARLAGGGVAAVLLDLSGCGGVPDSFALDIVRDMLRVHALDTPLLIAAATAAGFEGKEFVVTPAESALLPALLLQAAENGFVEKPVAGKVGCESTSRSASCVVLGFLGAKGGVGTTTAALNTAAILAQTKEVALAELRVNLGGLSGRLRSATRQGALNALLNKPLASLDPRGVQEALWTADSAPRLRVLSAPGGLGSSSKLAAGYATKLIHCLKSCSEAVILDLCLSDGEAVQAAASDVDQLVLVAERTPFCLSMARDIAAELFAWGLSRNTMCCLVVNRSPVGVPPPIEELESQLGIPVLGSLPPDPDGCVRSENLGRPIVAVQPDGLITQSLEAVVRRLETRLVMAR
jgi:Flp pilus assembly CpaE family ATPase